MAFVFAAVVILSTAFVSSQRGDILPPSAEKAAWIQRYGHSPLVGATLKSILYQRC